MYPSTTTYNYTYSDRRVNTLYIAFFDKYFSCFGAQRFHFMLLDDFTPLELFNLSIQVAVGIIHLGHLGQRHGE